MVGGAKMLEAVPRESTREPDTTSGFRIMSGWLTIRNFRRVKTVSQFWYSGKKPAPPGVAGSVMRRRVRLLEQNSFHKRPWTFPIRVFDDRPGR